MELFKEISRSLKSETGAGVSFTVLEGGGYFQNVKRIEEFSSETILLRGKKGKVRLIGRDLSLSKYYAGDVAVLGEILKVERE